MLGSGVWGWNNVRPKHMETHCTCPASLAHGKGGGGQGGKGTLHMLSNQLQGTSLG